MWPQQNSTFSDILNLLVFNFRFLALQNFKNSQICFSRSSVLSAKNAKKKTWELTIECILKENKENWAILEENKEQREKEKRKKEQIAKAQEKKRKFEEKQEEKKLTRKITDMFSSIPKTEAEKIEREMKRDEKLELMEMKKNLWRKWRGKTKIVEKRNKLPKEKLEQKLKELEEKIGEYKRKKDDQTKIKYDFRLYKTKHLNELHASFEKVL